MDCSLPGSSVHGISQAWRLEWVAIPSSRESSWPRDWTHVSCVAWIGRWILYYCASWETLYWFYFDLRNGVGLQPFWYFKLLTTWHQLIYWIMSLLLTNLKCHFDLKLFLYLVRSLYILSNLVQWSMYLFLIINNFNYWSPTTYFNRQWLCSWTFDLFSLYSSLYFHCQ